MKILTTFFLATIVLLSSCDTTAQNESTTKEAVSKTEVNTKDQNPNIAKDINLSEFDAIMADKNPILVDVRTAQEFAAGHIDGAINIDVMTSSFLANMEKLKAKDKSVILYCRSGSRSGRAMKMLNKAGYQETYNLMGGFSGYSKR